MWFIIIIKTGHRIYLRFIIVIETWHPASSEKASVSVHVDDAGKLLAAGSKVVPSGL